MEASWGKCEVTRSRTQEEGLVLESHGRSTHLGVATTGEQKLCAAGRDWLMREWQPLAVLPSEKSFGKAVTDGRGRRLRRKDRGVATLENSSVMANSLESHFPFMVVSFSCKHTVWLIFFFSGNFLMTPGS